MKNSIITWNSEEKKSNAKQLSIADRSGWVSNPPFVLLRQGSKYCNRMVAGIGHCISETLN